MDRRIQFAQTVDGVSIAFTDQGEGLPLVVVPNGGLSHLLAEVTLLPERDGFLNRLAQHFRVVRFDARGGGMSQRDGVERSFERYQDDIDAVADRLGLERFALFGYLAGAMVALAYAGSRPQGVSHLVIWPWYRMPDLGSLSAMASLERANWEAFTEMFGALAFRGARGDISHRYAALMREAMTPEGFADQWFKAYIPPDEFEEAVGELAAKVRCPTLVLQPQERITERGLTRLVGMLEDGALTTVSGTDQLPYLGAADECHQRIAQFLGAEPHAAPRRTREQSGLVTVMAVITTADRARAAREALAAHGSAEVRETPAGLEAYFGSAQRAIECAMALARSAAAAGDGIAVGIEAGERPAIVGAAFAAAERAEAMASAAGPGRVLVSRVVRELVAGKGFTFAAAASEAARDAGVLELRWEE